MNSHGDRAATWIRSFFRRRALAAIIAVCASGLGAVQQAPGQCTIIEDQIFRRAGADTGDEVAFAVSMDGNTAVIGVRGAGRNGEHDHGTVYVFRRQGSAWQQVQELQPSDAQPHDRFGQALQLAGDRLIVGAPEEDDGGKNAGAAYVFAFDGSKWVQQAKLVAPDPGIEDQFGTSVAILGDRALVGAPFDDEGADKTGAAFLFRRSGGTWTFEKKLLAGDAAKAPDQFGTAVALALDAAFVGAPLDNGPGFDSGAVYVFRNSGGSWPQEAKITLANGGDGDALGFSIVAEGARLLAGAKGRSSDRGSAVFFQHAGAGVWSVEQEVAAIVPASGDLFGFSVDLHQDEALIGAPCPGGAGFATVFRRTSSKWEPRQIFVQSDAMRDDQMGFAVAIAGRQLLAGAPFVDEGPEVDTGAAYFATSTDLTLMANPRVVKEGKQLELKVCHGLPGAPVLLFAVGFGRIASSRFDGQGEWSLKGTVPPGTAGLTIDFFAAGIDVESDVEASNAVAVVITP